MIKGIVFDIDGTLLQHEMALEKSLHNLYLFIKNKIPHSNFNEFLSLWNTKLKHYFNEYLNGKISFEEQRILRVQSVLGNWGYKISLEEALEVFRVYLVKYEQNWELYTDVLPCLNKLGNFSLGVISNGDGEQQRRKLTSTGINSFFKSIIISGDVGSRKPQPEIFQRGAKELNLCLNEIIYVGDHLESDAFGALNAGMHGVWINRTDQIYTNTAVKMISELTDLPKVIEQLEK
jgi:putative hydrolase of the HAD superfamily